MRFVPTSFVLQQAYAAKEEEANELEKDREKIRAKALKYKEANDALQEAVKEHQRVHEEVQAKLKAETKANSGRHTAKLVQWTT